MNPKDPLTPFPARPVVVVSKCLGFEACRYNGEKLSNRFLESLAPYVDLLPVCPEVEIGLGTPRDPIRLVAGPRGGIRLIQPSGGRDLSGAMQQFGRSFLEGLEARGRRLEGSKPQPPVASPQPPNSIRLPRVDGFVLKAASPSCAVKDSKYFAGPDSGPALGKRPGLFTQQVMERFPHLPVEDEGRLMNLHLREHFLIRIFTLARFRTLLAKRVDLPSLVRFHSGHKLLLMAYNQVRMRQMGRIVANPERLSTRAVTERYRDCLRQALARAPRQASNVNVLMHGLGYVSKQLGSREKAHFLDLLEQFTRQRVPLSTPLAILRSWIIRFDVEYLLGQVYFEPFPAPLFSLRDSGRGRSLH